LFVIGSFLAICLPQAGLAQGQGSTELLRLEFAVLPFGPCLIFGACDLELIRNLVLLAT
jgi:hypothetical protein